MSPRGHGGPQEPRRSRIEASAEELSHDRARALEVIAVSRETTARLDRFVATLLDWQQRMNLISHSTEATVWTRHVADSLQLLLLAPEARIWADLGSGGGFPGLAIACALADTPGAHVHLIESNGKKAAFLREAAKVTGAPATVHAVAHRGVCGKHGGNLRCRDRAGARSIAGAAHNGLSVVAEWRAWLISKGSRCRV